MKEERVDGLQELEAAPGDPEAQVVLQEVEEALAQAVEAVAPAAEEVVAEGVVEAVEAELVEVHVEEQEPPAVVLHLQLR